MSKISLPKGEARLALHDLIVVAGRIAGCAATLTAARLGQWVALIHDRRFVAVSG